MRVIAALAAVLLTTSMAFADATPVIVAPFSEGDQAAAPGAPAGAAATQQSPQQDWVSRTLHQSLVDDVAAIPDVTVLNASKPANPSDAKYIVRPTLQRSNGELRVSGRIEEAATGRTIGGFKANGTERNLFAIQDSIASQVRSALSPRQDPAVARQPAPQGQPAVAPQQPVMIANGVFEGSELQRALADRDYLRRSAVRTSVPDYGMPDYGYQQPLYPYTVGLNGNYPYGYGYGYGYPGYGWWGGGNVIIIKKGHGGHWNGGGGGWSGGGGGVWRGGGSSAQLRSAAVFGHGFSGQSNMVASPTSGQARVGGGGHVGGRR